MKSSQFELSESELLTQLTDRLKLWQGLTAEYVALNKRLTPIRQSLGDINILLEILDKMSPFFEGEKLQKLRDNQAIWEAQNSSIRRDLAFLIDESAIPSITPQNWNQALANNAQTAKNNTTRYRNGLKKYQKTLQLLTQHQKVIEQEHAILDTDEDVRELTAKLTEYQTHHITKTLQKVYDKEEDLLLSETIADHKVEGDITAFKNLAQAIFHKKPVLAFRVHQLRNQLHQFCTDATKELAEQLQKSTTEVAYKTTEERQARLRALLENGTKYILGQDMDFTFTDTALAEFQQRSDIYKQLAVEALNLGLSEHLPQGSLTGLGSNHRAYIDKDKEDSFLKIRTRSGSSGDDNLPRIIVTRLPYGPNKKERFCIICFLSKKEQETRTISLKNINNRTPEPWPSDPQKITILNPVSLPLSDKQKQQIQQVLDQILPPKKPKSTKPKVPPEGPEDAEKQDTPVPPDGPPVSDTSSRTTGTAEAPKTGKPVTDSSHQTGQPKSTKKTSPAKYSPIQKNSTQTGSFETTAQRSAGMSFLLNHLQLLNYLQLIKDMEARRHKLQNRTIVKTPNGARVISK